MWVGVLITLLVGGFLFYAFATAHKHIEDNENLIKMIQCDIQKTKILENKPELLTENKTIIKNIDIIKHTVKYPKIIKEQKCINEQTKNNQFNNTDVTGLYLFENIENSILYTYGMLVAVSLPKVPSGWAIRILTGWWWIYCLLVVVAYKASMTAILANPDTRLKYYCNNTI